MPLFNNKVTLDQILNFFNLDMRISDLISFKSEFYPISIEQGVKNKVKLFDEDYNSSFSSMKNELLFSTIAAQKSSQTKFNYAPSPLTDEDYYMLDDYNYYNLCHQFHKLYSNGKNVQLKSLESYIVPVIEAELNHSIGMFNLGSMPNHDYHIQELETEAHQIFHNSAYASLKLVIETTDFLKYLEERGKDLNSIDSEAYDQTGKIIFKGTPAQFVYIIELLASRDYIKEISNKPYRKAKLLLRHFKFENNNPTDDSLGKVFATDGPSIKNGDHRTLFNKMPFRDQLDK